jgi:hypothetical protein
VRRQHSQDSVGPNARASSTSKKLPDATLTGSLAKPDEIGMPLSAIGLTVML